MGKHHGAVHAGPLNTQSEHDEIRRIILVLRTWKTGRRGAPLTMREVHHRMADADKLRRQFSTFSTFTTMAAFSSWVTR